MVKKSALVTGITGFAGSHLAELLLKEGYEVWGITRPRSPKDHIKHIENKIKIVDADLLDPHSMDSVLKKARPVYVFHLAAQSFVQSSWSSPATTMETNVIGSIHLFEAIRRIGVEPVVQIACSSEEYGMVHKNELPIKETNPLRPLSPYAVSKVAMDYLGYQYYQSYGMKVIRTRGFNHTGPRRGDVFAESTFAKQIAEAEKEKRKPVIFVGNLEAKRDYTDVRDMVRGYLLAVQKCDPGEVYNISGGKAVKISEVLETLLSFSPIRKKIKIKKDLSRMRPSDVPVLLGDSTLFRKKTGWKPVFSFERTMRDLLDYWRNLA